jgi:hypothetical protein
MSSVLISDNAVTEIDVSSYVALGDFSFLKFSFILCDVVKPLEELFQGEELLNN